MCCRRIDEKYQQMEADLFNLIPVVSQIAENYQGRVFGVVKKPITPVGTVKVDDAYLEPSDEVKGDIAVSTSIWLNVTVCSSLWNKKRCFTAGTGSMRLMRESAPLQRSL